jgi:hypothetical protein
MKAPTTAASVRARDAWGAGIPVWVLALATACEATSQSRAAEAIGYSAATVSLVIRRAYTGDLTRVEQAVRGAWMGDTVSCPAQHVEMPAHQCVAWQRKPYDSSNHQTVRMFTACRSCPMRKPEPDADAGGSR